jgi:hypothetical protein
MIRFVWILAVATACSASDDPSQGTVVGNPGDTSMQLARSARVDVVEAYTFVDTFEWVRCNDTSLIVDVQTQVDLLDERSIESPAGEWCSLTIHLEDTLGIVTEMVDEEDELLRIQFDLDVEYLQLDARDGIVIDGGSTVIELGHPEWFDLEEIDLDDVDVDDDLDERCEEAEELWEACEDGDETACEELDEIAEWYEANCEEDEADEESGRTVSIDSESSAHDVFARIFMLGSALYEDDDSDGRLSDSERNVGSVAAGAEHPESVDEDAATDDAATDDAATDADSGPRRQGELEAGGCGGSESNLAWLLLPFAALRLRLPHR